MRVIFGRWHIAQGVGLSKVTLTDMSLLKMGEVIIVVFNLFLLLNDFSYHDDTVFERKKQHKEGHYGSGHMVVGVFKTSAAGV